MADGYALPGTVKATADARHGHCHLGQIPTSCRNQPSNLTRTFAVASRPNLSWSRSFASAQHAEPEFRTDGRHQLPDEIHSWYAGAVGERRVAEILSCSRRGMDGIALRACRREGSDIDHVLIGPAGVYTINTKHHANKDVWVAGRALRVSNHPQHHIPNAAFEARRAAKLLTQASGSR